LSVCSEKTPEAERAEAETPALRRLAVAQRALEEAARRRAEQPTPAPREIGGREGPEPTRYGDWEVKGLASDF
jgi:hypothetical protein